jgi:hypothetical protein
MYCKTITIPKQFSTNSLYFKQDGFVNLFYYGNLEQRNIYMSALKRSTYVGLIGFFLLQLGFKRQYTKIWWRPWVEMGTGWKSFEIYHSWWKGPSFYCNPFLPYILIPIKIMNKKLLDFSKGLYFKPLQF